jgi:hypothetical protein
MIMNNVKQFHGITIYGDIIYTAKGRWNANPL